MPLVLFLPGSEVAQLLQGLRSILPSRVQAADQGVQSRVRIRQARSGRLTGTPHAGMTIARLWWKTKRLALESTLPIGCRFAHTDA
eukprot:1154161-Pelagomonas_calceolata.AAC.1